MAGTDTKWRWPSKEAQGLFAVLGCIAIVALGALAFTWEKDVKVEVAKAALSVLTVAVFGGLATFALDRYRMHREDEAGQEQQAAAERIRQEENWRREVARLRDARERDDELLRSLLEETLRSYNRVKRLRRLLRAHTEDGSGGAVRLAFYDRYLKDLNDQQLAFEQFKRITPVNWASRSDVPSLKKNYENIEKYLNKLVEEYENMRHLVQSTANVLPLERFQRLSGFFESQYIVKDKAGIPKDIGFEVNVSKQIDEVIEQVQGALLAPLVLPTIPVPEAATSLHDGT